MQELTCAKCGAALITRNVPDEGLYGDCAHCRTSYLIDDVDRTHVVVDVRGMEHRRRLPSRRLLIGGGVAIAAVSALSVVPTLIVSHGQEEVVEPSITPLWNIGGKGPGAGQFRDSIWSLTIDGQGRSATIASSSPIVQLFDGDGRFLARWLKPQATGDLLAALPGGDLIFAAGRAFERRDAMTGRLVATIPQVVRYGTRMGATTPDGGFAAYYEGDSSSETSERGGVPDDRLVYVGPDGTPGKAIGPLFGAVIRPDPASPKMPEVSAMAIDGAGTIYLLVYRGEEFDTRGGIYAFGPDGVFLRKIEIEQKYHGHIAAGADGTLFHADPWMTRITRIKGAATSAIDLAAIERDAEMELGTPYRLAVFPNGDLGITTSAQRYLRVRWPVRQEA